MTLVADACVEDVKVSKIREYQCLWILQKS